VTAKRLGCCTTGIVTVCSATHTGSRATITTPKTSWQPPESSQPLQADLFAGHQESLDKDFSEALGTLSAEDLHLVSLVIFEDYPLAAAAAVLNMTPGAAKTRMHRAKQRMKVTLTGSTGAGAPAARSHPTSVLEGERS
jgi:DNA-directed RNA polymerase specialized sigma24 family protein